MAIDRTLPNAGQVRAIFAKQWQLRSFARAMGFLLPTTVFYIGSILLTVVAPLWLMPLLVIASSLAGALLFIISHDAAHDAFTPYHWLNSWLARLAFLPSWHPYTGWVHAHNHVHHGWTNFQPKDYVWAPLSLTQYRARSQWGQRWVRFCRWWPAFGCYYLVEVLCKRIWLPQSEVRTRKQRWRWLADDALLAAMLVLQAWGILRFADWMQVARPAWFIIGVTQIAPFAFCTWLIAFITCLQHTHPSIPWFQKPEEWSFYAGQIHGTVHTRFPSGINAWIYNVMEHSAHHVDPRIPLYHLPAAQSRLEDEHHPVQHRFTFHSFAYTQGVCQLYDFEQHRWLSYAGGPTSLRTFELRKDSPAEGNNSGNESISEQLAVVASHA